MWPLSLIPARYAAYHLRPYAKKLGAFVHFFTYICISVKGDETMRRRHREYERIGQGKTYYTGV